MVATVKSLQGTSIEDFANQLFRHWQLGQKDKNNGVLFLVAPNERKVRIEVGYGLEGHLTDAASRLVIENIVLPHFRTGDFAGGVTSGTRSIVTILIAAAEDHGVAIQPVIPPRTDNGDTWFLRFLVSLMVLWTLTLIIQLATRFGLLPEKRRGLWRILDLIVFLGTSINVSGSGSSSSGSSGYSGGGGSSGGGGASGSW